jgi:hypothetical protein
MRKCGGPDNQQKFGGGDAASSLMLLFPAAGR